jgi:hypothetical protein
LPESLAGRRRDLTVSPSYVICIEDDPENLQDNGFGSTPESIQYEEEVIEREGGGRWKWKGEGGRMGEWKTEKGEW